MGDAIYGQPLKDKEVYAFDEMFQLLSKFVIFLEYKNERLAIDLIVEMAFLV